MSVKVKICGAYQHATNGTEIVEVDGSTVNECLRDLIRKYPSLEKLMCDDKDVLSGYLLIFLNGENVPHKELNRAVKDDDEIFPLMMITGG